MNNLHFASTNPKRDGINWYVYVSNNPLRFVDPTGLVEVFANDLNGAPIIDNPGRSLVDRLNIRITRNQGHTGGYYRSNLSLRIGNQPILETSIQAWADHPLASLPPFSGQTLTSGDYKGRLMPSSRSYKNPIHLIGPTVDPNSTYFIHPDQFTVEKRKHEQRKAGRSSGPWSQPYSAGCPTMRLDDFDSMTDAITSTGAEYDGRTEIDVSIVDLPGNHTTSATGPNATELNDRNLAP